MKKINVLLAVTQSFTLALKNLPSFLGCIILWLITIWIPYVNVGTTIALFTLPIELSQGNVVNPLSIFAAKYRKKMGDYFLYKGLVAVPIFICTLFMVIPGMVLATAWSMGLYIAIEWDTNPIEALRLSNNITYGNKWRIWFTKLIVKGIMGFICGYAALYILFESSKSFGSLCLLLLTLVCFICFSLAVNAVLWKELKKNVL